MLPSFTPIDRGVWARPQRSGLAAVIAQYACIWLLTWPLIGWAMVPASQVTGKDTLHKIACMFAPWTCLRPKPPAPPPAEIIHLYFNPNWAKQWKEKKVDYSCRLEVKRKDGTLEKYALHPGECIDSESDRAFGRWWSADDPPFWWPKPGGIYQTITYMDTYEQFKEIVLRSGDWWIVVGPQTKYIPKDAL